MSGPKHISDLIGSGSGGNSLLSRLEATQAAYRTKVETAALPGETFADTEARLRREEEAKRASLPVWQNIPAADSTSSTPRSQTATTLRRPPESDRQQDFFVPSLYEMAAKDNRRLMDVALFRLSKRDKRAGEITRYELRCPPGRMVWLRSGTTTSC